VLLLFEKLDSIIEGLCISIQLTEKSYKRTYV